MKLCELILEDECKLNEEDKNIEIKRICTSLDNFGPNCLFFIFSERTLKDFIKQKKKCGVVIVDKNIDSTDKISSRVILYRCDNARKLLAFAHFRFSGIETSPLRFIGITGTNGKTSTAILTTEILKHAGYKVGFIGTGRIEYDGLSFCEASYSMTTPDPWMLYPIIRKMQLRGCEVIVMEVSSHALALEKISPITFDYGVFTNLSAEHLDFHNGIEEYFTSKKKLFSQCKKAIFNLDDHYARRAYAERAGEKIGIGILWKGDVWATGIENNGFSGIEYMYRTHSYLFKMSLSLAGIHNIYNSMLATAVCTDMGVKPCLAKEALRSVSTLPGRFEIIKSDITVIIDYAHTAFAFENLLKEIHRAKLPKEELWTVFGCGGDRDRAKRPLFAKSSEKYADKIIVTSDNSRDEDIKQIISDIAVGFVSDNYEVIEDRKSAIEYAICQAPDNSVIAIIGKGAEKYNIDKNGYHPFDERQIILDSLKCRKEKILL